MIGKLNRWEVRLREQQVAAMGPVSHRREPRVLLDINRLNGLLDGLLTHEQRVGIAAGCESQLGNLKVVSRKHDLLDLCRDAAVYDQLPDEWKAEPAKVGQLRNTLGGRPGCPVISSQNNGLPEPLVGIANQ